MKPVENTNRLQSLDLLRGIAILGILIMNIQSFAMPSSAYNNPLAFGDLSGFNKITWILSHLFADQKLFENLKGVLFPIGHMYENDAIDLDIEKIQSIMFSNYLSIVYTVSKLKKILILNQDTTIVGFGSISSIIGRKTNSNYAASKRALESYFESLAFEFSQNEINVQF